MSNLLKFWKLNPSKNIINTSKLRYSSTTAQTLPQEEVHEEKAQLFIREIKKKPERKPFMKNVFLGVFDTEILGFPEALNNEELKSLNEKTVMVNNFISTVQQKNENEHSILSKDVYEQCKNLRLFGLQAPIRYSGLELSETENCRVYEELAKCSSLAMSVLIHQYFGVQSIAKSGTNSVKEKYLSKLSSGEYLSAFCLLEEDCLDLSMMKTKAERQENDSFVLNGTKSWVVNGSKADVYLVLAETETDNSAMTQDRNSVLIVEKNFDGITIEKCKPSGLKEADICNITFKNTPVPKENVLGIGGDSMQVITSLLSGLRLCSGPYSIALMRKLISKFSQSALGTKRSGQYVSKTDIIYERLAQLNLQLYAMESITYMTAGLADRYENHDCEIESAIVKVFCSEMALEAVQECIKLSGMPTFMEDHWMNKLYNDALGNLVVNETNGSLRMAISLLGLQHAGMLMNENVRKARNPFYFPGYMMRKLWDRRRQDADNPKLKLQLENHLHPSLIYAARWLEYCVYRLLYASETLLVRHGPQIIEQHMELKRLAEVAIHVYAMTAVLSRASRAYCIGLRNADYEILLANSFCLDSREKVKKLVLDLANGPYGTNDINYQKLSERAFEYKGYFAEHPLTKNF